MPTWVALTEADVKQRLSSTEFDSVKATALATGLTNAITEALAEVTHEVRGYVRACSSNQIEEGAYIPPELVSAARDRLAYILALRLPTAQLLNDNRVEANKAAIALLEKVAACEFGISAPTTPTDDTENAGGCAGGQVRIPMRTDNPDSDYSA